MTPEELKREGKYSDEYQTELVLGCAVIIAVSMVIAAAFTLLGA